MISEVVRLGFKKVHPDAKIPEKAHLSDAGMDVCSVEVKRLEPFKPTLVKTGLVANIPEGYELQVRPRSGLSLKYGVTVWNSPGTIDEGYKGEIGVIMLWTPNAVELNAEGEHPSRFIVSKGDRIAQLVLAPVVNVETYEVQDVGTSDRGEGGFGSTGV